MINNIEYHYKQHRSEFPDNFRLRIHRALSWLKKAEETADLDTKFITLWIAFNAAYAREMDEHMGEKSVLNGFLQRICILDQEQRVYDLIWQKFSGSIRLLVDNEFVFQPFWDFHNGEITEREWQKAFYLARDKVYSALENKKTDSILVHLFNRLYTLRNQLIHGGATFNSRVNRAQLKDGCNILSLLIPSMLQIMMENHNEIDWGKPYYHRGEYLGGDMSLLVGQPHRQVCLQCNWKSETVFRSDCIVGEYYPQCPKCGGEVELKPVNPIENFFFRLSGK